MKIRDIRPEKALAAMIRAKGVARDAAKMLHCRPYQLLAVLAEHPELTERLEQAHSDLVDDAILSAKMLVQGLDKDMTKFVLKSLGQSRGFRTSENIHVSGADGGPIKIQGPDLSSLSDQELEALEKIVKGVKNV